LIPAASAGVTLRTYNCGNTAICIFYTVMRAYTL
jgi:hypothetical protein